MPTLFTNIEANILDHFAGVVKIITLDGMFDDEDYIKLYTFDVFTQHFSKVAYSEDSPPSREFALLIHTTDSFDLLEISY